ncbi:diacylglycerol kinase family protein [Paenibacillus arenilitoris]|uniref:Diacylglycerol kinase family protein n=1 Tax=Paenibacillus arenilitoris TaxID=2772299 RepID=A0A927CJZ4_9BACL|nr:diacylglycerol kinase family protein [Paenibacillus arenilitoris]MBD2869488.1 diacylglycerol kinase family protein [Paenibacillus arenilitoris]
MAKFICSLGVAFSGIGYAIRTQSHMRVHMIAAAAVCGLGWLVSLKPIEWAVILLTIAVVFSAEMMNTAVEQAVDLASPGIHPVAKIAKDVAAGAVLVAAIIAVVIGLLIIGPPLWRLLFA